MNDIERLLTHRGPARAGVIAQWLHDDLGISLEAARRRVSRVRPPIRRFPVPLLPKREHFVYLQDQRKSERFWTSFRDAMRETNSIYGYAIDALLARGGMVPAAEFEIISGAPNRMKKQISSTRLLETLVQAGFVKHGDFVGFGEAVVNSRYELGDASFEFARADRQTAKVLLDALREWVRKLGFGSYNSVRIRGEPGDTRVGPFSWDLTAPSYLAPLQRGVGKPGFVVADVFVNGLDEFEIRYFTRKVQLVNASSKTRILPILVADGFTYQALRVGKAAGVMMATITNIFGERIANALRELVHTLRNAAAVAASNPKRLAKLVEDLSEIEGAAGNLRGILFELITAHLARLDSSSVEVGVPARDPTTGKTADIDVLSVHGKSACTCIECKGKAPGGKVGLEEVDNWLARIPVFREYLVHDRSGLRESDKTFELWTTGVFTPEALAKLEAEKAHRTRSPIDWKDGNAVRNIAKTAREKAIRLALDSHFLKHPLSEV